MSGEQVAFIVAFVLLCGGLIVAASWRHDRNRKRRERGDRQW